MKENYGFWDNLFLPDGRFRNLFNIGLILSGILFGLSITNFTDPKQIAFFVTSYLLGVPCVIALADRRGIAGNLLGILSNFGEVAINILFKTYGMAISGVYFGLMHVIGMYRWNNPKFVDEDKKVKVSKLQKEQVAFTAAFMVVGLIVLVFAGGPLGFSYAPIGTGSWATILGHVFYWGNLATFVVSVLSQYLMIMGKSISWFGWGASNVINFILNLMVGNFWFMFRDAIYQANVTSAIYSWKKAEKDS